MFAVFSACTFKNRQKQRAHVKSRQLFSFMLIIWIICSECVFLLEEVPIECVMLYAKLDMHIIYQDTREGRAYAIKKVNDVWSKC
jgi:hypothetical protein